MKDINLDTLLGESGNIKFKDKSGKEHTVSKFIPAAIGAIPGLKKTATSVDLFNMQAESVCLFLKDKEGFEGKNKEWVKENISLPTLNAIQSFIHDQSEKGVMIMIEISSEDEPKKEEPVGDEEPVKP